MTTKLSGAPYGALREDLPGESDAAEVRVTTLELFFDLVFVFTFAQLAAALSHDMSLRGLGQTLLIFGLLWWMYGGYAWLTNHLPPRRTPHRLLLLLGMGGFLVAGLSIPGAFHGDGVTFGVGYLLVICVHIGLFLHSGPDSARNILGIAPFHVTAASLVIAAGFLQGTVVYVCWCAALLLQVVAPFITGVGGFEIQAGHFVERHGLLMIVALGEAFVSIGTGSSGLTVGLSVAVSCVSVFAIPAGLWWVYFDGAEAAEEALNDKDVASRSRLALAAFFYAHMPMLFGLVLAAAAIKQSVGHPFDPMSPSAALALAGGVALFLSGIAWFRALLRTGPWKFYCVASVVALAPVLAGIKGAALAEVAVLVALISCVIVVDNCRELSKGESQ